VRKKQNGNLFAANTNLAFLKAKGKLQTFKADL